VSGLDIDILNILCLLGSWAGRILVFKAFSHYFFRANALRPITAIILDQFRLEKEKEIN